MKFSPYAPGNAWWPSARIRSIASNARRHAACAGVPWIGSGLSWPSPFTLRRPMCPDPMGRFGTPPGDVLTDRRRPVDGPTGIARGRVTVDVRPIGQLDDVAAGGGRIASEELPDFVQDGVPPDLRHGGDVADRGNTVEDRLDRSPLDIVELRLLDRLEERRKVERLPPLLRPEARVAVVRAIDDLVQPFRPRASRHRALARSGRARRRGGGRDGSPRWRGCRRTSETPGRRRRRRPNDWAAGCPRRCLRSPRRSGRPTRASRAFR